MSRKDDILARAGAAIDEWKQGEPERKAAEQERRKAQSIVQSVREKILFKRLEATAQEVAAWLRGDYTEGRMFRPELMYICRERVAWLLPGRRESKVEIFSDGEVLLADNSDEDYTDWRKPRNGKEAELILEHLEAVLR
jgi:hypothetical protein